MSLALDTRQRAILLEMGIRHWAPVQRQTAALSPAAAPHPSPRQVIAPPIPAVRAPVEPAPDRLDIATLGWDELESAVAACRACRLCESRKKTVFGVGHRQADWLIVGEAPGENEDLAGEPFVGQAGKLLDNMLRAIGLSRRAEVVGADAVGDAPNQTRIGSGVYIANVLKCRPPANRNPDPQEVLQCEPYLRRQVALLQPRIILAMGRFAVQSLLQSQEPIGKLRGRVHSYQGVPVIVTYHPAYLLRSLSEKSKAWADLCLAMQTMRQSAQRPPETSTSDIVV